MGYDKELAGRIRDVLAGEPGLTEKRIFGGLAFLIDGHLAASASSKGGMLLRVDPEETAELIAQPSVSRFRMRGREMDGWLHVESPAIHRGVAPGLAAPRCRLCPVVAAEVGVRRR